MPQIFVSPPKIPRPRLESPAPPGVFRPSGEVFTRQPAGIDIGPMVGDIDKSIAENHFTPQDTPETVVEGTTELHLGSAVIGRANSGASLIEDLPQERLVEAAFCRFVGRACVREVLEGDTTKPEMMYGAGPTLAKSITETNLGSQEAEARVDINVGSALAEAYFKKEHFTRTKKQLKDGKIVQLGLTTEQMHRDSLVLRPHRPRQMMDFTLAEVKNGLREEEAARRGELKDSWLIAASCVPENMPEELLDYRGDGYFTRYMTYSLQGTTQEGADIITETVFDQGTAANEYASYEERQAQRFDLRAIGRVYEKLGLPAPKTALEMLQKPIRVPKSLMPNGMVDFWRWVDIAADELRGEAKRRTAEEYLARIDASLEREASLTDVKLLVKQELLKMDGTFKNDNQAIEALWELARTHGPKEAVKNKHINPLVFGVRAAHKLVKAKNLISLGDLDGAEAFIKTAQEEATVSGCGAGSCGLKKADASNHKIADMMFKLKFEAGDNVVQDAERACTKCGQVGEIVYVYNESGTKVNKGCTSCGAIEMGGEE